MDSGNQPLTGAALCDDLNFGAKLTIPFVESWNFTKIMDIIVFLLVFITVLCVLTSFLRFSTRFLDRFWSILMFECVKSMIFSDSGAKFASKTNER